MIEANLIPRPGRTRGRCQPRGLFGERCSFLGFRSGLHRWRGCRCNV